MIPFDFGFLKRGGRISKTAADIGSLLKLNVCMKKSDDGKCLEKFAIARTIKKIIAAILKELVDKGVDESYYFYITHAQNRELADKAKEELIKVFPKAKIEIYDLSPVFITQGGPKCCAIQAIKIPTDQ